MTEEKFTYSEVFRYFGRPVILSTRKLIKSGILKKEVPIEDKSEALHTWMKEVSGFYNLPCPDLVLLTEDAYEGEQEKKITQLLRLMTGGGFYSQGMKTSESGESEEVYAITLCGKISLTTFLHEYRHHMQVFIKREEQPIYRNDIEEDARAWSCSLYRVCAPKMYQNAVDKGLLHYS